ncbi:hypothetical protein SAMN06295912_11257 [Sphingomonas laterariae]|uniref:Uncharacterized protein n=1 Tax=Edaphosphingomonas laterariae TaxID=861865 RepID=A0A239GI81_9SPHN|nr:hypothetical protein [Sphingomonas laterariae]SNS68173.1 hypothetical protein SAMN06295912_11257 [Sphingomonas laterariae]
MTTPASMLLSGDVKAPLETALPELLHAVMVAGGSNVIVSPSIQPDPSPADAFGQLVAGASSFQLAADVPLADHFWDHAGEYRRGAVAARLRDTTGRVGKFLPGFLAIYATSVRTPLVYGPHRMPFRVAESIDLEEGISGPYLVLVACRLLANGKAQAVRGFAQPILDGRRFVPVFSELERDVLCGLIGLQGALDAHGVDCTIKRAIAPSSQTPGHDIELVIERDGAIIRELSLAIARNCEDTQLSGLSPADYVVGAANWADGAFISWLEQAILSPLPKTRAEVSIL